MYHCTCVLVSRESKGKVILLDTFSDSIISPTCQKLKVVFVRPFSNLFFIDEKHYFIMYLWRKQKQKRLEPFYGNRWTLKISFCRNKPFFVLLSKTVLQLLKTSWILPESATKTQHNILTVKINRLTVKIVSVVDGIKLAVDVCDIERKTLLMFWAHIPVLIVETITAESVRCYQYNLW